MPRSTLLALILFLALLAACAPPLALPPTPSVPSTMTPTPHAMTPAPTPTRLIAGQPDLSSDPFLQPAADAAREVTAATLGISPDEVTVIAIEPVEWNDASLGCPQPGYVYAQVITPGYSATVEAEGQTYEVHMDSQGYGLICPPPAP